MGGSCATNADVTDKIARVRQTNGRMICCRFMEGFANHPSWSGEVICSSSERQFATTAMPQGLPPDMIFFTIMLVERSTTETSLDRPFAVYRSFPSGDKPMPHGRSPTSNEVSILFV